LFSQPKTYENTANVPINICVQLFKNQNKIGMNLFTKKISEHPTWVFFAVTAVVVVLGLVIYNMLYTQNLVVTANNGSFLKQSLGGPLDATAKAEAGAKADEKIAGAKK
jgi:hypothetical protein